QGANLIDEGELDLHLPNLAFGDEGLVVKVDKEGVHKMRLSLKVPVSLRRSGVPAAGTERGFELGLPGAAVTTLALEVPESVKEIRWNESLAKRQGPAGWSLLLGNLKSLSVSWKEPVTASGGVAPMLTADSQVAVRLDEMQ